MDNKFVIYMNKIKKDIDIHLEKYLKNFQEEKNDIVNESIQEFTRMNNNGKRIRGSLIKLGQDLFGNKNEKEYLDLCSAYELFQTAILIHDDLIDRSKLRRNEITIHEKYEGHLGVSKAICTGDLGFFFSYDLIAKSSYNDTVKCKLYEFLTKVYINTTKGEIIDTELPYQEYFGNMEEVILNVYKLKTAWYTITGPLCLGAISSDASNEEIGFIKAFGEYLGIGFQIHDDLLGIYGEEDIIGKSINSDIEEKKNTILYHYALNNADKSQLQILDNLYGKSEISNSEVNTIRDLFIEVGAKDYTEQLRDGFLNKAKQLINDYSNLNLDSKEILIDLADFLMKRMY